MTQKSKSLPHVSSAFITVYMNRKHISVPEPKGRDECVNANSR